MKKLINRFVEVRCYQGKRLMSDMNWLGNTKTSDVARLVDLVLNDVDADGATWVQVNYYNVVQTKKKARTK
jgi:hypothetical protein